jgi:diguanylate cyclase (GGDEF)-like protein
VDADGIAEPSGWEDALTGLEGPDLWRRVLVAESARSFRYGRDLTIVVAELDGLDAVVDAWGADAARRAMHAAAQCLRRMSRTSDYPTRIARATFGVVLTETDEVTAINYVERVREELPRSMPPGGDLVRLTFGWASLRHGESAEAVVARAESRLLAEMRAGV